MCFLLYNLIYKGIFNGFGIFFFVLNGIFIYSFKILLFGILCFWSIVINLINVFIFFGFELKILGYI